MRLKLDWARGAAIVAGLNLAAPQAMMFAAEAPVTKPAAKVKDVKLTSAGELTGRVVTAEGKAVDGVTVTISQNGKPVTHVVSTGSGEFKAPGMKSGLYQVSAVRQVQYVRAWPQDVAPPSAMPQTTFVQGNVVRGQDEFDYLETDEIIIGTVAFAALGIGIGALVVANDNDDNGGGPPPASP
ncbi:hypothetical protein Pan44_42630 [Caulifigura coniformis]|uniref:Carboxypeptidase regulatory-like domain-containing protein n=1 Tax=Caulifigura coniformis TaxID=2527983 RepID=A0A517SJA7_9PLAN|nr:carboxypeptidase-like regulatory domain-containing protein [Caulifigura coniformis]QDT56211.1 hypothetical protein Pan44_42630 [Caulifigura coniformis]